MQIHHDKILVIKPIPNCLGVLVIDMSIQKGA